MFQQKKTQEESKFAYNYKGLGSQFDIASSTITLKYSPNSKNIMTPTGKYTYEQNLPELYLNYEQGFKTLDGDFNFSRFDHFLFIISKQNWVLRESVAYGESSQVTHRSGKTLR